MEPNPEMRRAAERGFDGCSSFHSVSASAEQTGLPTSSIDLVIVGQALHWFDISRALPEFARILKPSGWLATVWNQYEGAPTYETIRWFASDSRFERRFPVSVAETWEQYIGGLRSAADAPLLGDVGYGDFEEAHRRRFAAQAVDGLITIHYTTELVVGRPNLSSRT